MLRVDRPGHAIRIAGGIALVLATAQYAIAQLVAASAWHPAYSWTNNLISDLGNTACGPFAVPHGTSHYVCSPDHTLMNGSFVLGGVLTVTGAVLLRRMWPAGRMTTIALILLGISGILKIVVGIVPENTIISLHVLGALNLPVGSVAIGLLSVVVLARRRGLAMFGIVIAVVGFTAAVLTSAAQYAGSEPNLGLGAGGMERLAGYPGNVWMLVVGTFAVVSTAAGTGPVRRRAAAVERRPVRRPLHQAAG